MQNFRLQLPVLSLRFQYDSTVKVKCTAMLQTVYLKSNEITLEVEQRNSIRRRGGKGGDRGRGAGGSAKSAKRDRLTSASSSGNGGLVPALESRDGEEAMPSSVACTNDVSREGGGGGILTEGWEVA